jgi:hypothetical protein
MKFNEGEFLVVYMIYEVLGLMVGRLEGVWEARLDAFLCFVCSMWEGR